MNDKPVTSAILQSLAEDVAKELDLTRRIAHPGESGRAREQILTAFIRRLVPSTFGVSTGFVLDAVGGLSRQVDIVVYRTDYAPVFEIGSVKHFLAESVIAVMEVKAAITTTERLDQALENIRSVKQLDRSNRGHNYVLNGQQRGQQVDLERYDHQVFGAIVTERSLSRDVLRDRLLSFLRMNPRRVWPNIYVDVHGPIFAYTSQHEHENENVGLSSDPTGCTDLWLDEVSGDANNILPLIALAQQMIDLFRIVPTIDFWPASYIPAGPRIGDHWPISPDTDGPAELLQLARK